MLDGVYPDRIRCSAVDEPIVPPPPTTTTLVLERRLAIVLQLPGAEIFNVFEVLETSLLSEGNGSRQKFEGKLRTMECAWMDLNWSDP